MLVPALLYKDEIYRKSIEYYYSKDYFYYTGWIGASPICVSDEADGSTYQWAIVDGDKLIGYFTYTIKWLFKSADSFGLISFDKNNKIIGIDVRRKLKEIIDKYHLHRIEWRMIGGNPVEKHYDKFCNRYGGKKHILRDKLTDETGKYYDDIIYEIIFD